MRTLMLFLGDFFFLEALMTVSTAGHAKGFVFFLPVRIAQLNYRPFFFFFFLHKLTALRTKPVLTLSCDGPLFLLRK